MPGFKTICYNKLETGLKPVLLFIGVAEPMFDNAKITNFDWTRKKFSRTDGWVDGWVDGWMGGWIDG